MSKYDISWRDRNFKVSQLSEFSNFYLYINTINLKIG